MIAEKILVVAIDLILSSGSAGIKDLDTAKDLGEITHVLNSRSDNQTLASQELVRQSVQSKNIESYSLEDFQQTTSGEFALRYKFLDKSMFALVEMKSPKNQSVVDLGIIKDLIWDFLNDEGRNALSGVANFISIAKLGELGIHFSVDEVQSIGTIILDPKVIGVTSNLMTEKMAISATSADVALTSQFTINQIYSELESEKGERVIGFGNLAFVGENSELSINMEYIDEFELNNIHFSHNFDNKNKFLLGDINSSYVTNYINQERIRGFKFYNNPKIGEIENDRIITDTESDVEIYVDGILRDSFHVDAGTHDLPLSGFNYDENVRVVVRDIFGKIKEFEYLGNKRVSGFNGTGEFSYSLSMGQILDTNKNNIDAYLSYGFRDDIDLSAFYQNTGSRWLVGAGAKKAFNNENKVQVNSSFSSFDDYYGYKADLMYQYRFSKNISGYLKLSNQDENFGIDEQSGFNKLKTSLTSSMSYTNLIYPKDSLSFNYSYYNSHNKKDYSRKKASLSYKIEPVKGLTLNSALAYDVDTGNSVTFGFTYRPKSVVSFSHSYEKRDYIEGNTSTFSVYKNRTNLYGNVSDSNTTLSFDGYYDNDKFGLKSSYQKLKEHNLVKYNNSVTFGVSATKNSLAFTREATRQPIIKISLSDKAPESVEFNFIGMDYTIRPGESIIIPNLQSYREYSISVNSVRFPMGYATTKNSYKVTTGDKGVYDINIDVVKRRSLTGLIVDANGNPLKYFEGQVIIDGVMQEFFTDEKGEYFLYNVHALSADPSIVINIAGEKISIDSLIETENSILRANKVIVPRDLSYFMKR